MGKRTTRLPLHNAGRCACHRPPAALGTANARPCFNEPFLWGVEPAVPPTAPSSFSTLAWKLLRQTHPEKQGCCSLHAPLRSIFTLRRASVMV